MKLKKSILRIGGYTGSIQVDYSNPFDYIMFHFFHDLAEPYKLKAEFIKYVEPKVDETLIYARKMNLHHSTGQDLVNIYFDKARDDIDTIEIELFLMMNGKERLICNEKGDRGKIFSYFFLDLHMEHMRIKSYNIQKKIKSLKANSHSLF